MDVKRRVWERDGGRCVICGSGRSAAPNAHYIPRSHMGLGIEQNIVTLCMGCHTDYDNSAKREEYGAMIREYLKRKYRNWDEKKLVYRKYGEIEDYYNGLTAEKKEKVRNYIDKLLKEEQYEQDNIDRQFDE